jgi:hypothetical protein
MRNIEIDLAQPFEKVLASVLSLPMGCSDAVTDRLSNEAEIKKVIRGLYEAANGRHVETTVGLIMIAPPVYAFLKAKPFSVTTQTDLLIEAATRLIVGPAIANGRRAATGRIDRSELDAPPRRARRIRSKRLQRRIDTQSAGLTDQNSPRNLRNLNAMTKLPIHSTTHHLSLSDFLRKKSRRSPVSRTTRSRPKSVCVGTAKRKHASQQARSFPFPGRTCVATPPTPI